MPQLNTNVLSALPDGFSRIIYLFRKQPRILFMLILVTALLTACIEPYSIPAGEANESLLVVDGFLNDERDTIVVRLSYTKPLDSQLPAPAVTNADVFLLDGNGNSFAIPEKTPGVYYRANLPLSGTKEYRLRIKIGVKEYQSDVVTSFIAPPIDSVSWRVSNEGLDFFVNTHDSENKTKYYRWDYLDTYEYTSGYESHYKFDRTLNEIVPRTAEEQVYHCWKTEYSKDIHVYSTATLGDDIVTNFFLTHIPPRSRKALINYSILVRQYPISKEEFYYWQGMEKLSESLGTLFDAQPSEVSGNLKCLSHPSEQVIGYFRASNVTEKRAFVSKSELPAYTNFWFRPTGYEQCSVKLALMDDIPYKRDSLFLYPVRSPESDFIVTILGYDITSIACADCRYGRERGTNIKPDYWK